MIKRIYLVMFSLILVQVGVSVMPSEAADGLFGSISTMRVQPPTGSDPVAEDLANARRKHGMKTSWQSVRRATGLDLPFLPFQYTIDRYKFMGEAVIAHIDGISSSLNYYLIILHYNIPTTRGLITGPLRYNFVRVGSKIVGVRKEGGNDTLCPVRTISIFPVNDTLPVSREDLHRLTARLEPQWAGAKPGYLEYMFQRTDKYMFGLPKVMGTVSRFGDVFWTYYPAKAQQIIQGAQTCFAVIAVDPTVERLQLLSSLEYSLKYAKFIPMPHFKVYDTVEVDISSAQSTVESRVRTATANHGVAKAALSKITSLSPSSTLPASRAKAAVALTTSRLADSLAEQAEEAASATAPINPVLPLDKLAKIHVADLPQEIKTRLSEDFKGASNPFSGLLQGPDSACDYLVTDDKKLIKLTPFDQDEVKQ